jgi:hypothetical protein
MKCAHCKKAITSLEVKKAVLEYDDNNRLKAALHLKCSKIRGRRASLAAQGRDNTPTAYEMRAERKTADDLTEEAKLRLQRGEEELERLKRTRRDTDIEVIETDDGGKVSLDDLINQVEGEVALAARQVEIAAESLKEERPERWDDARDPSTAEI